MDTRKISVYKLLIITLLAILTGILFLLILSVLPGVLPGITVEGEAIGGLNFEEARRILERKSIIYDQQTIELLLQNQNQKQRVNLRMQEIGMQMDVDRTLAQATMVGKTGWGFQRFKEIILAIGGRVDLPVTLILDKKTAEKKIEELSAVIEKKPVDAELKVKSDYEVEIIPAVWGETLDKRSALKLLESYTSKDLQQSKPLVLEIIAVRPRLTTEEVAAWEITGKISEAQTRFNAANKPRTHNIRLAVEKINKFLLPPGEVFSFNEVVGPRTKEAGYQEAMIIIENEFEPGLGGGVCQVSSTLYNAVLMANLSILERRRHSLVVGYVAPGLDATVAYGYIDFKFANNTGSWLLLQSKVINDILEVKIFGNVQNVPEVTVKRVVEKILPPKTIVKYDPNLPPGSTIISREGSPGYIVKVLRLTMVDDEPVTEEFISVDTYPAVSKIVGTGSHLPENFSDAP